MPKTISGQAFHIVSCKTCENKLSFQYNAKPFASQHELSLTCTSCGHSASYPLAQTSQSQAEYAI